MQYKYPVTYHLGAKGPVRGVTITAAQADAAMRYVMDKFRVYGPWSDGEDPKPLGWDGTGLPGDVPTLTWGYSNGHPAITWEGNSPHEWAYAIEDRYTDEEFGFRIEPPERKWPAGINAEPDYSFILVLYRED